MFKFDFDIDDVDEEQTQNFASTPVETKPTKPTIEQQPFTELSLTQLLDALPSLISYSPITIPLSSKRKSLTLVRRDLFDARFQLISEGAGDSEQNKDQEAPEGRKDHSAALEFIDAPSDLVPGVYEGGLKTWECSLDLVDYLDGLKDGSTFGGFQGRRILELGCGTGVPSLYILYELLSVQPSEGSSLPETHLHLQDYNASVLELVTLPNLLLIWYMSPASLSFRESADSDVPTIDPSVPSEIPITPELKSAFLTSLQAYRISVRLFSGSWETFDLQRTGGPYNVVLTSETIYRTDSIRPLITLLQATCDCAEKPLDALTSSKLSISQGKESTLAEPTYLCLVAAKVLYFGVGGGVSAFTQAIEQPSEDEERRRGTIEVVWERKSGVGRRIMDVRWCA